MSSLTKSHQFDWWFSWIFTLSIPRWINISSRIL